MNSIEHAVRARELIDRWEREASVVNANSTLLQAQVHATLAAVGELQEIRAMLEKMMAGPRPEP